MVVDTTAGTASGAVGADISGSDIPAFLAWIWGTRWAGLLAAAILVALCALGAATVAPRGPVTSAEALVFMGLGLGVGFAVGLVTGSRWSMLLAPLVFAVAFEIKRLSLVGPTVDAIDVGSLYGVIALFVGRLFTGILVFVPLAAAARFGVSVAARLGHTTARPLTSTGWTGLTIAGLAIGMLVVLLVRPASTAPVIGSDGGPLPGSTAELITVPIGDHDLSLMIRGRSTGSPVLLFLAGGPGGTEFGAMRRDVGLEQDFVVVTWDQRGSGTSYAALDPTDTLTLDGMVADTIAVTEYLRGRFSQEKIYLVGQSWGSTLGVLAAQERPDLYHAFVGVGQMVSQRETDIMFWEDTLAWAEATDDTGLAAQLRRNGPPPYANVYHYEPVVSTEHSWNAYPGLDLSHEMPGSLFVPEYTFMDRLNAFRGFFDVNATLYPQLQGIDFRVDATELLVPYYMVVGEHEARGRAVLADEWFDLVVAPSKQRIVFEGAGHRANFDQPGRFAEVMRSVLHATDR